MELSSLPKITVNKLRRVGRGHGSGRGKTAGRGTKGQKARRKIPAAFEGGALPLVKRLPFLRGRGRNKVFRKKPVSVSIAKLNSFRAKSEVNVDSLISSGFVDQKAANARVKIIDGGELKVALIVKVPVSRGAKAKIEKAGGQVLL